MWKTIVEYFTLLRLEATVVFFILFFSISHSLMVSHVYLVTTFRRLESSQV